MLSAVVDVPSARARVEATASNLPPALMVKVVKAAEGASCNVQYAFPDIGASTIRARAMAAAGVRFPLAWNPAYAPAVNESSNALSSGVSDSQLRVSGCVGHGSNSVSVSQYLKDYGASVSLLQTSNRYYLAGTEGGLPFFSVGASDGRLTYGLSNAAFGPATRCVMQNSFGFGACNVAVGVSNPMLGTVSPTLVSSWYLSNVKYYPQGAWNVKPPIIASGGKSYTDSNFGLSVGLSNFVTFADTALAFSVTGNTNASVPFSTTGANANVLTLSSGHAAVAAGSNTGTLTLSVVNSLDTTGFAAACNVAVPYTVFALAPPAAKGGDLSSVVKSLSNVSLPTFGSDGFTLMPGGSYSYSLTTNQLSNAVVDAGTGALTVTGVSGCNAVYSVGVTAADQFAQSAQRLITVTSVPLPTVTGSISLSVDSASNLSIPNMSSYFVRHSTGAYTYSLTDNPFGNASINVLSGDLSVVGGVSGVYTVGVRITDQVLQQADQAVGITSTQPSVEYPPTIIGAGNTWVKETTNTFTGYQGVVYSKYSYNVTGAAYGNGTYRAWANMIYLGGGTALSSAYGNNEWPPSGAFDKRPAQSSTKSGWHTPGALLNSSSDASTPADLYIQLPSAVCVKSYSIQHRTDCCTNQGVSKWDLHGSIDNSAWTNVDSRTGVLSWALSETKSFTCSSNSTKYLYYRLEVYRNSASSTDYMSLGELRLFGYQ